MHHPQGKFRIRKFVDFQKIVVYFAKQNFSLKKYSGEGDFCAHCAAVGLMERSLKIFNVAQNSDITNIKSTNQPNCEGRKFSDNFRFLQSHVYYIFVSHLKSNNVLNF